MREGIPGPGPEQPGNEQSELFSEEELADSDKDMKKLLEIIKEADIRGRKEEKKKKKGKAA
ncbi:MAG: hypothetical protein V2A55_01510 [Candidatus Jorgensenbacteria bacterium]